MCMFKASSVMWKRPYVDALVHIQVGQSSLDREHE